MVRNSLGGPAMDMLRLQLLDSSRDELYSRSKMNEINQSKPGIEYNEMMIPYQENGDSYKYEE